MTIYEAAADLDRDNAELALQLAAQIAKNAALRAENARLVEALDGVAGTGVAL